MNTEGCDNAPQAARLAPKLRALADRRIYFGTSSWKEAGLEASAHKIDLNAGLLSRYRNGRHANLGFGRSRRMLNYYVGLRAAPTLARGVRA